ncbi:hypothetical protein GCM10022215_16430 [Nocardioides fonticola]|uniref:Uncharacterized protein n=1 Tax=Nocardioides fonticola TaxID=450363 RepID=A0ABP7XHB2_9ACTN
MNVKDLIEALANHDPEDYVQVLVRFGDAGYVLRDLDIEEALEWDEDGHGVDHGFGVEISCHLLPVRR